jgi:hypothetical protein
MYIYIYIYVYIHIYLRTYIQTYVCIFKFYLLQRLRISLPKMMTIYTYIYIFSFYLQIHVCMHVYVYIYIFICLCVYIYVCSCIYVHSTDGVQRYIYLCLNIPQWLRISQPKMVTPPYIHIHLYIHS